MPDKLNIAVAEKRGVRLVKWRRDRIKTGIDKQILSEQQPIQVLITGGTGFIGSNLAERLLTDRHRVHGLTI